MLLGDTDIENPIRVSGCERCETDGVKHGGGHPDNIGAPLPQLNHGASKSLGPRSTAGSLKRCTSDWVNPSDSVKMILLISLSSSKSLALGRHDMDDDGMPIALSKLEGSFDRGDIVAVNRAEVLDTQIGENPIADEGVFNTGLSGMHETENLLAEWLVGDMPLHPVESFLVVRISADNGKLVRQPPHCRGVGTAIVVNDND